MPLNANYYSLESYAVRLRKKRSATSEERDKYRVLRKWPSSVCDGERAFLLEPEQDNDRLDPVEKQHALSQQLAWDDITAAPASSRHDQVDRRPFQTSIKDQEDRGTCVCFASLAGIEAKLKSIGEGDFDLSENYANWLFMRMEGAGRTQCDDGLKTTLSAQYLSTAGVCLEELSPYEDLEAVELHCAESPSATALAAASYGIGAYSLIDRLGRLGPSIANPECLEALLTAGNEIVLGTHVAWGEPDADGVFDVILDQYGNPLASSGGHAMLIVGYDTLATIPHFIVKNSWGTERGVGGYYYLSYDYISTYAKYGYVIQSVRTDMPSFA